MTETICGAHDVDERVLRAAVEAEEWFPGRIDWDHFWDRLEECGFSIEDADSPAANKIRRYIQKERRSG